MNSKKTLSSTLVILSILLSALALPAVALADSGCESAGTSGDDIIVCDTDTTGDVKSLDGDDEITVETAVTVTGKVNGGKGADIITNDGTVTDSIAGGGGKDVITNSGTAGSITGDNGNDKITNGGTVKGEIAGGSGGDKITISGTVTKDVKANDGNDMVILETGVQVGGMISGSNFEKAAAKETDTLVFNMSTYDKAEYDAAQTVIASATNERQAYKFAWDGGAIRWQYFDTLVDKMTLLFKSESKPEPEPEPELEPAATATLVFIEEGILKAYQNDVSGTLRFYGLGKNSQTFIAELTAQGWENAESGKVLLDVESVELDTHLVITMLENGQLQVEYFSLADGVLLFSKVVAP